jgi:hypothetical protein
VPTSDQDWARAYAKQALSDLTTRDVLAGTSTHKCHRLHFLQMAAEKVCKAYLSARDGHEKVRKTHAYVEKNLPLIARMLYSNLNDQNRIKPWQMSAIRKVSHEIEVLAPACDDGGTREDNSEYPWEDGHGDVCVPCEYNFPKVDDGPQNSAFALLIKILRAAAESYNS